MTTLVLPSSMISPSLTLLKIKTKPPKYFSFHPISSSSNFTCHLGLSFEHIASVAQNKVLISAAASAVIGQFSKPFTAVFLYGNTLDFRTIVQAGGFPSTHSSAVMATATTLALERGFSDSIFGLSLVYAILVMYDAQGVRREVGIHARTINRSLLEAQLKSGIKEEDEDMIESVQGQSNPTSLGNSSLSEKSNALRKQPNAAPLLFDSRLRKNVTKMMEKGLVRTNSYVLKESIGHTKVEVIAGALLGTLVSLIVHAVM